MEAGAGTAYIKTCGCAMGGRTLEKEKWGDKNIGPYLWGAGVSKAMRQH